MCKLDNVKMVALNQVIESIQGGKPCIHVTSNNSKCGRACLCLSNPPEDTCRLDAPCFKDCYCMKGTQRFKNVLTAYYRNYFLYTINRELFKSQLDIAIKANGLPLFRFFDAGDLISFNYLLDCIEVVKKNPSVTFLMYTKQYYLINEYLYRGYELPSNLRVLFSTWSKEWKVNNPYNMRLTFINFEDSSQNLEDIPKNAYLCKCDGVTCSSCKMCFNPKVKAILFNQH